MRKIFSHERCFSEIISRGAAKLTESERGKVSVGENNSPPAPLLQSEGSEMRPRKTLRHQANTKKRVG